MPVIGAFPLKLEENFNQMTRNMSKDFHADTYVVDSNLADTLHWLSLHQDSYDSFSYDAVTQELVVHHANGTDQIRIGDYLNARYGILITAHNFAAGSST